MLVYFIFMDEDGFTLVKGGRQAKKRKAEGSPQLNSPPGASTASPTSTPARPKSPSFKNVIPVILRDVDPKLCTKVKLMSELKQFHPHIKVSKVLEKKNNSFLITGDTPRDVAILQSETKMKACLGQNVKISLPKAYQSSQPKKSLVIKGVPAEVSEQEFKEFLDLDKINYAKAERLISKKDDRVLEIFKLEIKDDIEAKALIAENLTCPVTGIIYREFRIPISVQQCYNCQCFGQTARIVGPKPSALSVERPITIKDARIKKPNKQSVLIVKGHMLHPTKGVRLTKNRHLGNMWWTTKNHMRPFYAKT